MYDAIKIIVQCGQGALVCNTNTSDAFKLIPKLPSQYHLFCVKWRNYTITILVCRLDVDQVQRSLISFFKTLLIVSSVSS